MGIKSSFYAFCEKLKEKFKNHKLIVISARGTATYWAVEFVNYLVEDKYGKINSIVSTTIVKKNEENTQYILPSLKIILSPGEQTLV